MRCTCCGLARPIAAFDPQVDYEPAYSINTFGGRGMSRWETADLPLELAKLQLTRLKAATVRLAARIAAAEAAG